MAAKKNLDKLSERVSSLKNGGSRRQAVEEIIAADLTEKQVVELLQEHSDLHDLYQRMKP